MCDAFVGCDGCGGGDELLPLPPAAAHAEAAPGRRRKQPTAARRRLPGVRRPRAKTTTAEGLVDAANGGFVPDARSRAASQAGRSAKPLVDFHDDLRSTTHNVDNLTIATDPALIAAALAAPGTHLLHHVMSQEALMLTYDFAMHHARDPRRCGNDFEACVAGLDALVGKLVPLASRLSGTGLACHRPKLAAPHPGHPYALQPVFVSVASDFWNDQGGIFFQCVPLTGMGFNHPLGHERRLRTGSAMGDAFDDTWIVAMVTHVYATRRDGAPPLHGIPWAAVNPNATFAGADGRRVVDETAGGRNTMNDVFRWKEYMAHHADDALSGAASFALTECKQMRGLLRRLLPPALSVAEGWRVVDGLGAALPGELARRYATMAGHSGRKDNRRAADDLCGNDLRKCLLAIVLLNYTPLAGVLTSSPALVSLPPVPPTTAAELFEDLRAFLQTPRPAPALVAYQTMYEKWM